MDYAQSPPHKGLSQTKTEATGYKKIPFASGSNLAHNPETIWHSQQQSKTAVLSQCYEIIRQQEAHIERLENDIKRKDSIISNLLTKNQGTRIHHAAYSNGGGVPELERVTNQMLELYTKYERAVHQNQYYQSQLEAQQKMMRKMKEINEDMQKRQKEMKLEIEEGRDALSTLKKMYEAKIAKLLGQIKRKIEDDIHKSMRKRIPTDHVDQPNTRSQLIQNNQQLPDHLTKVHTPQKIWQSHSHEASGNKKGESSWNVLDSYSEQKRIKQSPENLKQNFILASFKAFPNQEDLSVSIRSDYSEKKKKPGRILGQIRDVEFITDSYDDSLVESGKHDSVTGQCFEQVRNSQKISIKKIVDQYGQQRNSRKGKYGIEKTQDRNEDRENRMGGGNLKQQKKINVEEFLEELRRKVSKFECQESQDF